MNHYLGDKIIGRRLNDDMHNSVAEIKEASNDMIRNMIKSRRIIRAAEINSKHSYQEIKVLNQYSEPPSIANEEPQKESKMKKIQISAANPKHQRIESALTWLN